VDASELSDLDALNQQLDKVEEKVAQRLADEKKGKNVKNPVQLLMNHINSEKELLRSLPVAE
jgi:polyhydroxyalkanoate synthesis regulator protein